jgi:hypothetical protein
MMSRLTIAAALVLALAAPASAKDGDIPFAYLGMWCGTVEGSTFTRMPPSGECQ